MDVATIWYLVIGFVLIAVGVTTSYFQRLPITTSIIYFVLGMFLGHTGFEVIDFNLFKDAIFFSRLTEVVVLVSLFSAGLKLRQPFRDSHWAACWRLATVSMIVTIALVAAFGFYILHMPFGLAVLVGAVLAPTDPVLASEVQVADAEDRDRLRFSLTGEAGLNDGTALPFVLLGLGLLGIHDLGTFASKWLLKDVLLSGVGGLLCGWFLGTLVSKVVLKLRSIDDETVILDDFLAIGLVSISYGIAEALGINGFLAVFAAGLAMRKIEKQVDGQPVNSSQQKPTTVAKAVLSFTEQMERIGEVFVVILLGAAFDFRTLSSKDLILLPFLFLVIRPISVFLGLLNIKMRHYRKPLISWFGIRGIGTIYYVTFVIVGGLSPEYGGRLRVLAYGAVVASLFIHGISGFPAMSFYQARRAAAKNLTR
jgi:NhaP-type Na+/H+ or K+/H+ antiporter